MKNHYVQQYVLKEFATKCGGDYHIQVVDFSVNNGGWRNTHSAFYSRNLYSDELENEFNCSIETTIKPLFDKLKNDDKNVMISREEFNLMKKYILLQLYRTPDSFENLSTRYNDRIGMIEIDMSNHKSENKKEYWNNMMLCILRTEWDSIDKIGYSVVRYDKCVLDRLFPMLIKSNQEPLIVCDTGYYCEDRKVVAPSNNVGYWKKAFSFYFQRDVSREDTLFLMKNKSPYLNFLSFPLSSSTSILLIDDVWRFYTPEIKKRFDSFGITSGFLEKYLKKPYVLYENQTKINESLSIEDNIEYFSRNDQMLVCVVSVPKHASIYLNILCINNCYEKIGFRSRVELSDTINCYKEVVKHNPSLHDFSFDDKIDYDKPLN